jgi:hypothetical protein
LHSRGVSSAVYKTAAVAAEPRRRAEKFQNSSSTLQRSSKHQNPNRFARGAESLRHKKGLRSNSNHWKLGFGTSLELGTWNLEVPNGRASGYRALYSGLAYRRVSLNTYARKAVRASLRRLLRWFKIGIPCGNCTRLCGFANRRLGCSANGMKVRADPISPPALRSGSVRVG